MGVNMNKQLTLFPNFKHPRPEVSELKKFLLNYRIKEVIRDVKKETL